MSEILPIFTVANKKNKVMKFQEVKVQKVSQTVTPFAGISFINQEFYCTGLSKLIDNHLGIKTIYGYQYSEIFSAWFDIFFCGGSVAEDIFYQKEMKKEKIILAQAHYP